MKGFNCLNFLFLLDQKLRRLGQNLNVGLPRRKKKERQEKSAWITNKVNNKQSNAFWYTNNGFKIRVITIVNVTLHNEFVSRKASETQKETRMKQFWVTIQLRRNYSAQ